MRHGCSALEPTAPSGRGYRNGKQSIGDRVVLECRKLLTGCNIEKIAAAVAAACEADYDSSAIRRIKVAIQEANAAAENLWSMGRRPR